MEDFSEVVRNHYKMVFRLTYRYLGNIYDAEDATQEVFLRAYRYFSDGRMETGNEKGLLLRIAINYCLNEVASIRRRKLKLVNCEENFGFEHGGMDESMRKKEIAGHVKKALEKLPPAQRIAILLSKYEGYSYKEIADAMGKTVSSVESLIVRGRKRLAGYLSRYLRELRRE